MADDAVSWSAAWEQSALGPHGFYRSAAGHAERTFATHVTTGTVVARRIVMHSAARLEALLSSHDNVVVTDLGAADGTLIAQLMSALPERIGERVRWRAIDVRPRPVGIDERVAWIEADVRDVASRLDPVPGLVVAHELLDDVPCDILEIDDHGARRIVLVDPSSGREELGPSTDDAAGCRRLDLDPVGIDEWCDRWWPRREPAARVEVGRSRDAAWAMVAALASDGLAIAVDYAHVAAERSAGVWDGGTLAGYRDGRLASAVPDGSRNITAHVALDSCAAAVSDARTVLERSGDGDDFWWLVQAVGR